MPHIFGIPFDLSSLINLFGDAASSEFLRTSAIFTAAAFVHASQVRKEIKSSFQELVSVLKDDLDMQRNLLAVLSARVDKLEQVISKIPGGKL